MAQSMLITGFPGFLATRIIERIVEIQPDAQFVLVILKSTRNHAELAVAELMQKTGKPESDFLLLDGDITVAGMGLSAAASADLANRVDYLFHLAAVYDLSVPSWMADRINVTGTQVVNRFAATLKNLKRYVYFSTAYVSGDRSGVVTEHELNVGQGFKNHYEETKYRAELLVQEEKQRLPITIIRPGIVMGNSNTGETPKFDGPYYAMNFISRIKFLPVPYVGRGAVPVNLVPSDYVVNGAVHLAFLPEAEGETVHLTDPAPLTARELFALFTEKLAGKKPSWMLPAAVVDTALRFSLFRKLFGVQRETVAYFSCGAEYDTTRAEALLAGSGITCPKLADFIEKITDYYTQHAGDSRKVARLPQLHDGLDFSGGDWDVYSPATGKHVGSVKRTAVEKVPELYWLAHETFPVWSAAPVAERVKFLREFRLAVVRNLDAVVQVIVDNCGKPHTEAIVTDVLMTLDGIKHIEDTAEKALRRTRIATPLLQLGKRFYTEYHPKGAVLVIAPWNYPFMLTVIPVMSALAAGNTVIVKPSEVTPLVGALIERLVEIAGFPQGVVQVAQGDGTLGAALVGGDAQHIFLTGSVATGKKVQAKAAERLIPTTLELGGKDPMVVFGDADLERAADGAVWGAFSNAGQMCMSVERVYVEQSVYEKFLQMVHERAGKLDIGSTEDSDVGSMTCMRQHAIVTRHLDDAQEYGADIIGGERDGAYIRPAMLTGMNPKAAVLREETFGPLMPIIPFASEEEAIALANSTEYGLNASIWTRDLKKARRVAGRIVSGAVVINDVIVSVANHYLPFGGEKQSGLGRYHGEQGLRSFCRETAVVENPGFLRQEVHWFPYKGKYPLFSKLVKAAFGETRDYLGLGSAFMALLSRSGTFRGGNLLRRILLNRELWRLLTYLYAVVLLVASIAPMPDTGIEGGDKVMHAAAYFLFGLLMLTGFPALHKKKVVLFAFLFGFGMELIQWPLAWRTFSVWDMVANGAGALAAFGLFRAVGWLFPKLFAKR